MTPSCSLVEPMVTRTSRARIRPFTRICCCRISYLRGRRQWSETDAVNFMLAVSRRAAQRRKRTRKSSRLRENAPTGPQQCPDRGEVVSDNAKLARDFPLFWRIAVLRAMRFVAGNVVQHCLDRRRERGGFRETRENRAIADRRIDHECRP